MSNDLVLQDGKRTFPVSDLGLEIGRAIKDSGARVDHLRIAIELKIEHKEEVLSVKISTKQKLIGLAVLAVGVLNIAIGGTALTVIGVAAILIGVAAIWTGHEISKKGA